MATQQAKYLSGSIKSFNEATTPLFSDWLCKSLIFASVILTIICGSATASVIVECDTAVTTRYSGCGFSAFCRDKSSGAETKEQFVNTKASGNSYKVFISENMITLIRSDDFEYEFRQGGYVDYIFVRDDAVYAMNSALSKQIQFSFHPKKNDFFLALGSGGLLQVEAGTCK